MSYCVMLRSLANAAAGVRSLGESESADSGSSSYGITGSRSPWLAMPARLWNRSQEQAAAYPNVARLALPRVGLDRLDEPADPVVRLVLARAVNPSARGVRRDGAQMVLAIGGGGMAGAVSAGMCAALEALGLIGSFDAIYGSSAGAINAS